MFKSAKEIWDAVHETYSKLDDSLELFSVESALHDLRQGDMTVTQYFNALTRNWQQFDMYEEYQWHCPEDSLQCRRIIEKKRLYKFLLGLKKELDDVRGRILGANLSMSLCEAFAEVRLEESRKRIMLGNQLLAQITESLGLSAINTWIGQSEMKHRKTKLWCDHCRKPGHSKEIC